MQSESNNSESANDCTDQAGVVAPVVDRNRCEGKEDCVHVCPFNVFEVRKLEPEDRSGLSLRGKVKAFAHRYRQAYVVNPQDCHACGLCIESCPEAALSLESRTL
jgi:NAD-dependent dihydropyrimidine dehydrogenase PreA subunit